MLPPVSTNEEKEIDRINHVAELSITQKAESVNGLSGYETNSTKEENDDDLSNTSVNEKKFLTMIGSNDIDMEVLQSEDNNLNSREKFIPAIDSNELLNIDEKNDVVIDSLRNDENTTASTDYKDIEEQKLDILNTSLGKDASKNNLT